MKRTFLSLQIQDKLENLDPFSVRTWEPVNANSLLTRGLDNNDTFQPNISDGKQIVGNKKKNTLKEDDDEDEVMVLFPCQHRKEIKYLCKWFN